MANEGLNRWQIIHTYNNLVDDGKAEPLRCPDENGLLIPMIDSEGLIDDPVLWCHTGNTIMKPGIDFWDQIGAVVRDAL